MNNEMTEDGLEKLFGLARRHVERASAGYQILPLDRMSFRPLCPSISLGKESFDLQLLLNLFVNTDKDGTYFMHSKAFNYFFGLKP